MSGLGVGSRQADRSQIEPSYLTNGDPGISGGGTTGTGDTNGIPP